MWQAIADVVSAIAAVASAVVAFRAVKQQIAASASQRAFQRLEARRQDYVDLVRDPLLLSCKDARDELLAELSRIDSTKSPNDATIAAAIEVVQGAIFELRRSAQISTIAFADSALWVRLDRLLTKVEDSLLAALEGRVGSTKPAEQLTSIATRLVATVERALVDYGRSLS